MTIANVGYNPVSPLPAADSRTQPAKQEVKTKPQDTQSTRSQALDLQRIGNSLNKKLQFVVDHSSNEVIVKVIDKETDKVIKELPPKELQRLHSNIKEAIGLLFNEMV